MTATSTMKIAGLEIPIRDSSDGPMIAHDPAFEPLRWFITLALERHIPDLREQLERKQDVHYEGLHAVLQPSGDYLLSGDSFPTTMTLSPAAFLEVLATLEARHAPRINFLDGPSTLAIAGLELPLKHTTRGPLISKEHPEVAPLAWLIYRGLEGWIRDLSDKLYSGEDIHVEGVHAVALPDEMYRLTMDGSPTELVLPAAAISEIYAKLRAIRMSKDPWPEPPRVSADVVAPTPPPPPPTPTTIERPSLPMSWEAIEERAAELDRLVTRERTLDNLVEESVKRRFLRYDLDDAGLLKPTAEVPAQLPTLRGYHDAVVQLAEYLTSDIRGELDPEARPTTMLEAPVSLDWFRLPKDPPPSHMTSNEWLAFLENILTRNDLSEHGGQGEIFVHVGDDWYTLHWRTDDGSHPAVVKATKAKLK